MATTTSTQIILVGNDGKPVRGATATRRDDGAWDVKFRLPWENAQRTYIRALRADAEQLLLDAAGQVQAHLENVKAEEERLTALADSVPLDNRP